MPTYEYVCKSCGTHVEVFLRISDEPLAVCGVCGGVLRKVFHPAGILLKGSGFYKTDNRPAAKTDASSSSSSSSSSSGSSTSSDSSDKSDAKGGAKEKSA